MESKGGTSSVLRKQGSSHVYQRAPIAARFEDCLQYFERLSSIIETYQEADKAKGFSIESAFSQFRQWGSDTGAQSRTLDHALRKATQLEQATNKMLEDLLSALHTAQIGLQNAVVQQTSPATDYFTLQLQTRLSDQLVSSRESSDSETSLQQFADDIEECVTCLIKLVPVLRNPAPQNVYEEHSSLNEADGDIDVAKKMFPKATRSLSHRFGLANWRRRKELLSLKSREPGNLPLGRSSNNSRQREYGVRQTPDANVLETTHRTAAFTMFSNILSPGSSSTGTSHQNESIFSKLDYFSYHSTTSVDGSDHMMELKHLDVPDPPVKLESDSVFDCPYCGQEIVFGLQVNSREEWDMHVLLDLEPYMCTFDDCLRINELFGVRGDWFQHELEFHRLRKIWSCHSCNHTFDEITEFELHLKEKHLKPENSSQLALMVSVCEKYSEEGVTDQVCPFCGYLSTTVQALEEHVGSHMEQLALSSIYSVYGLEREVNARSAQDRSPEKKAKLEFLNNFVNEQRGYFWKPSQEPFEDVSAGSNVAFAEDSEEEIISPKVQSPREEPAIITPGGRPQLKRRGDSWMSKVNGFLDKQTTDQAGKESWLSKVQTYLETQSVPGQTVEGENLDSPTGPTNPGFATGPQGSALPVLPHCLRTRPPPRNEAFIGRETDLTRLHNILSDPGTSCLMSGTGGIGKTSTAIEYTYRYEAAYSYIFWVSAETSISCADTYSLIATEFILSDDDDAYDQGRLITLSREFLERSKERWLLVFDNMDLGPGIQEYLPTRLHDTCGSVLITSRSSDCVDSGVMPENCQPLELEAWTMEESRSFLLNSMQGYSQTKDLTQHPEYNIAGVICKEAEGLPLALSHIAGYVQVSECSLTDFVQLWNERRRHTKSSASTPDSSMLSTEKTLEAVWNIGLREVTIDARELLNILAFLDSDNIQRKLLVGEHEEPSLDFLHSDQSFRYKRMITELRRRNIISVSIQNDEENLSIHRSLQRKILKDLDRDAQKREKVFSQAFDLVRKRFPLPSPIQVPEPAKWPACKEYLPHVLHLQNVVTKTLPSIAPSIKTARLLSDGGINLWERGMTSEGLRLLKSAETILDRLDTDNPQLRANIDVVINLLIQDCGFSHMAESEVRIRRALDIRLEHLKQCKPELYTRNDDILLHNAWSDYGCVLLQYNKFELAQPIFQQCLTKYRQWGTDTEFPYEYYKYNHHTAFCRLYEHDLAGATELAEESLRLIALATGQSSATSKTRFDLACIVLQSGDAPRALALHKEVLESNLRQHGHFNFLTLQSYYAVGAMSACTGNLVEAEQWMRKSLNLEKSRQGTWSEAANARTQFHLSQILSLQDKEPEEGKQLASRAREVLDRLLPLNPLEGVEAGDELALYDHLQPVFDGRFVGAGLLGYVSRKESVRLDQLSEP